jgi:SAM-dependent methyltransferase
MNRNLCEICSSDKITPVYTIEKMPVRIGTAENNDNYKFFDLTYTQCNQCNNIQILNLPNPYDVYEENHNKNIVGQTWIKHNAAFSNFILNEINEECRIFEIGDPSAKIASIIGQNHNILTWDIIEPKAEQIDIPKVKMIDGFFDNNFKTDTQYDFIILSHVFEHLTNYAELISAMNNITKDTGKIIISVPNMQEILNAKSMPPLHMTFEHTVFLNKTNIQELFKKNNFSLKNFETFGTHSDFYVFEKNNNLKTNFENLMPKELSENILEIINLKQNKIKQFCQQNDKNIYDARFIYGSHIHSQMYLKLGLDETLLTGVLDNDVAKHNKFLYGTNLKVFPVSSLKNYKKPLILLDMGAYEQEIKKQIKENFPDAEIF